LQAINDFQDWTSFSKKGSPTTTDQCGDVKFPSSPRDVCTTFMMQTESRYCIILVLVLMIERV
jgi:hypothetical protein